MNKHFIILDEANYVAGKLIKQHSPMKINKSVEFLQIGRAFGEIVILASNNPSDLEDSVHVNTSVKIVMSLGFWNDVYAAGKSVSLSFKQMDRIPSLKSGEAILTKEGTRPFWTKLLPFPLPLTHVTDKQVDEHNATILSQYKVVTRKDTLTIEEFQKLQTCPSCGVGKIIRKEGKYGEFAACDQFPKCSYTAKLEKQGPMLTPEDQKMLMDIALRPTDTKTTHYTNLTYGMDKGSRITKKLLQHNLIRELTINTGGKGGASKILHLTDDGYKAINMPKPQASRGEGPEHSYWIKILEQNLQGQNLNVSRTHSLKGKKPDIALIYPDGTVWALEVSISTNASHEAGQIRANLKAGYDHVISLMNTSDKMQALFDQIINTGNIDLEKVTISQLTPNITSILTKITEKGGDSL